MSVHHVICALRHIGILDKLRAELASTYAVEIVAGVLAIEVASAVLDVAGVGQLSNVQLGEESEHLHFHSN